MKNRHSALAWSRHRSIWTMMALLALTAMPASAEISLSSSSGLAFGSVVRGSGGGTVTVPHDGGSRNCSADVTCIPQDPGSPARFDVSGDAQCDYSIGLPGTVTLSDDAGNDMTIDTFVDSEGGSGSLDDAGNDTFTVRATLHVGRGQASGSDSGSFEVTVDYQ